MIHLFYLFAPFFISWHNSTQLNTTQRINRYRYKMLSFQDNSLVCLKCNQINVCVLYCIVLYCILIYSVLFEKWWANNDWSRSRSYLAIATQHSHRILPFSANITTCCSYILTFTYMHILTNKQTKNNKTRIFQQLSILFWFVRCYWVKIIYIYVACVRDSFLYSAYHTF